MYLGLTISLISQTVIGRALNSTPEDLQAWRFGTGMSYCTVQTHLGLLSSAFFIISFIGTS
jgi:hypothetical protein